MNLYEAFTKLDNLTEAADESEFIDLDHLYSDFHSKYDKAINNYDPELYDQLFDETGAFRKKGVYGILKNYPKTDSTIKDLIKLWVKVYVEHKDEIQKQEQERKDKELEKSTNKQKEQLKKVVNYIKSNFDAIKNTLLAADWDLKEYKDLLKCKKEADLLTIEPTLGAVDTDKDLLNLQMRAESNGVNKFSKPLDIDLTITYDGNTEQETITVPAVVHVLDKDSGAMTWKVAAEVYSLIKGQKNTYVRNTRKSIKDIIKKWATGLNAPRSSNTKTDPEFKKIEYLKTKRPWTGPDIQRSLDYLYSDKNILDKFTESLDKLFIGSASDFVALCQCIDSTDAEYFERYDSEVAEEYIRLFLLNIFGINA